MPRMTSLLLTLIGLVLIVTLGPPVPAVSQNPPVTPLQSTHLCPSLPPPTGTVVNVSNVVDLQDAMNNLTSGTTIVLAGGTYELHGAYLWFDVPNVTLRSASGNRGAVIIDGNYETTKIVTIAASNVTIADLTLRRANTHPIHVIATADADTENTTIYNVHIIDPREQAIKINPDVDRTHFPDNGTVACSHIELTDEGRPHVSGCYTGGVDAHQAWGWAIRDNVIEGFWCESGLSEHAVHFWTGSRDTVVEHNVLVNNARGVGFGLGESGSGRAYSDDPCPSASGYVGHFGGIVRNNFVFASRDALFSSEDGFDCGICLEQACGAGVFHNTVVSTQPPVSSSVEWRFSNTSVEIKNNLVSHDLVEREGDPFADLEGNLEHALLSLFVDGAGGDLHLAASASEAIDQGVSLAEGLCDDDIDGDVRTIGLARDIGADEYGVSPPTTVTDLRVTQAITGTGLLTTTLRWTAPIDALTATLRYSDTLISEVNWADASLLTDTLPGNAEVYTPTVPYAGGMVYYALRSRNEGGWSSVSSNAFWPTKDVFLPLVLKEDVP